MAAIAAIPATSNARLPPAPAAPPASWRRWSPRRRRARRASPRTLPVGASGQRIVPARLRPAGPQRTSPDWSSGRRTLAQQPGDRRVAARAGAAAGRAPGDRAAAGHARVRRTTGRRDGTGTSGDRVRPATLTARPRRRAPARAGRPARAPCSLCALTIALSRPSYAPAAGREPVPGAPGVGMRSTPRRGQCCSQRRHRTRPGRPHADAAGLPRNRSRAASRLTRPRWPAAQSSPNARAAALWTGRLWISREGGRVQPGRQVEASVPVAGGRHARAAHRAGRAGRSARPASGPGDQVVGPLEERLQGWSPRRSPRSEPSTLARSDLDGVGAEAHEHPEGGRAGPGEVADRGPLAPSGTGARELDAWSADPRPGGRTRARRRRPPARRSPRAGCRHARARSAVTSAAGEPRSTELTDLPAVADEDAGSARGAVDQPDAARRGRRPAAGRRCRRTADAVAAVAPGARPAPTSTTVARRPRPQRPTGRPGASPSETPIERTPVRPERAGDVRDESSSATETTTPSRSANRSSPRSGHGGS